jgi:hypothetical protein
LWLSNDHDEHYDDPFKGWLDEGWWTIRAMLDALGKASSNASLECTHVKDKLPSSNLGSGVAQVNR